jgi:hypothetical protein
MYSFSSCTLLAKQDSLSSKCRFEDKDFLTDLFKCFESEASEKDETWTPLLETLRECSNMSWAECCFQVLKRFHITMTSRELADDLRANSQGEEVEDWDYVWHMRSKAQSLACVLSKSEALSITAANLRDSRVRTPAEEKIRLGEVTSFHQLLDLVVDLNNRYVGTFTSSKGLTSIRSLTSRQMVNHLQAADSHANFHDLPQDDMAQAVQSSLQGQFSHQHYESHLTSRKDTHHCPEAYDSCTAQAMQSSPQGQYFEHNQSPIPGAS